MSDRLAELVRQRALVQEHLAWLNREIAAVAEAKKGQPAKETIPPTPASTDSAKATPMSAANPISAADVPTEANEIIARYQATPATVRQDVRKGCLLYFATAVVVLGLVVVGLYFALRPTP